jgi:predicted HicB family RNase H-like nuclease
MLLDNQVRSPAAAFDRQIIVYVPDEMAKEVAARAAREMISASAWLRKAILDRLHTS